MIYTIKKLKELRKMIVEFRQHLDFGYSQDADSIDIDNVAQLIEEEIEKLKK